MLPLAKPAVVLRAKAAGAAKLEPVVYKRGSVIKGLIPFLEKGWHLGNSDGYMLTMASFVIISFFWAQSFCLKILVLLPFRRIEIFY